MTVSLQSFASGDTDYISKLNNNNTVIAGALNTLQGASGAASAPAALLGFMSALMGIGQSGIIGVSSFTYTLSGTNFILTGGYAWDALDQTVVQGSATTLNFGPQASGTYFVCCSMAGVVSIQTSMLGAALYAVVWSGSGFTSVTRIGQIVFSGSDETATLTSVTNSTTYLSLEARLEAIETAAKFTGSGNKVLATPANGSSGPSAIRQLVSADLPVATDTAPGAVYPDQQTVLVDGTGKLSTTGVSKLIDMQYVTGQTGNWTGTSVTAPKDGMYVAYHYMSVTAVTGTPGTTFETVFTSADTDLFTSSSFSDTWGGSVVWDWDMFPIYAKAGQAIYPQVTWNGTGSITYNHRWVLHLLE